MLNFYSIYHLNMMYSAIEVEQRPQVINRCYWPLLRLAESGIPLGIEVSALSLKIILDLDPDWMAFFKKLIFESKVELIGSGYAQIIGPIVPHEVNSWNQKLGMEHYHKYLGIKPTIALVNELAYSAGMIAHYRDAGYEALVMEWNNPRRFHPEWPGEWRYHPQQALDPQGKSIGLIWADSIAFQKFQRCAHQESKVDDHLEYLKEHGNGSERYFPLYANDTEIFNFRPNRYETEAVLSEISDWDLVTQIYERLNTEHWSRLVLPSKVLEDNDPSLANNLISLESAEQPLPVKKQEKYNIIRWALTGRDDLNINTICYRIYHELISNELNETKAWLELCYLWSSDFRTHLTVRRWDAYLIRLNAGLKKWEQNSGAKESLDELVSVKLPVFEEHIRITEGEFYLKAATDHVSALFNKRKGLTIRSCIFNDVSPQSLFGALDHGYYDDISLGADYFSAHAVIEALGEHKITDLGEVEPYVYASNQLDSHTIFAGKHGKDRFHRAVSLNGSSITFHKTIYLSQRSKERIHPFIFTLNETAWDKETLYFATQNGHASFEYFDLDSRMIDHSQSFSLLITAKDGLGATGGTVEIGDHEKKLIFSHDQTLSALIPYIVYRTVGKDKLFIRLIYSAQEIDETFIENKDVFGHRIRAQVLVKAARRNQ